MKILKMTGQSLAKKVSKTRNLDHVIVDIPNIPLTISYGCQIVHLAHQNVKILSSKFNPLGLCEIEWFP